MLYLDGKPEKKYRRPLTGRIFAVCLCFTVLLCVTMALIGFLVFERSMMTQFKDNLGDIIALASKRVDAEDIEHCIETGEASDKYVELSAFFDQIMDSYSLDHIALTKPVKEGDKYDVIQVMSGFTAEELVNGPAFGGPFPEIGDRIGKNFPREILPQIYDELLYSRDTKFMLTRTEYGDSYRGAATICKADGTPVVLLTAGLSLEFIEKTRARYLEVAALATIFLGMVFITVMVFWLKRRVIAPLGAIENAAGEFEERSRREKNPDVLVMDIPKIKSGDELESLSEALSSMSLRMKNYVEELMESAKTVDSLRRDLAVSQKQVMQFSEVTAKDALTGIRNKTGYDKELEKLMKDYEAGNRRFGIAFTDIDGLKKINAEYGHDKGNLSVKYVCRLVCTVFDHSPVFRIGGDEFAVVLKGSDYEHIEELVAKFNNEIERNRNDKNANPWEQVSVTLCYTLFTEGLDYGVESVCKRAEKELNDRKKETQA